MHYHNGNLINDNGERTLICSECKRLIGFTDGEMKGYIIRAICSCGGLIKKTKHHVPSANDSLKAAYLSGNDYICPNCGRIMFRINRSHIRNLAFIAVCKCGEVFREAKDINARDRSLSGRAILVSDKKDEQKE